MEKLGSFLDKFRNIGFLQHKIKDCFIETVKNKLDIEITRNEIEIKDKRIIVRISGPIKTELILTKKLLLEELNSKIEHLGSKISDIN
jgi:hypothetical protein